MTPEDWLDRLRAELPGNRAALELGSGEVEALLELARVAAHTSERWAAPLSTFLAGVALGQREPADREAAVRDLASRLDPDG